MKSSGNGNARGWQVAIVAISVLVSGLTGKIWGDFSARDVEKRVNWRVERVKEEADKDIDELKGMIRELSRKIDRLLQRGD